MNVSPPLTTTARQLAVFHLWKDDYDESHVPPPTAFTTPEPTSYPTDYVPNLGPSSLDDTTTSGSADTTNTPYLTKGSSTSWGYSSSEYSNNNNNSTASAGEEQVDTIMHVPGWYTGLFVVVFFVLICFSYLLRFICVKYFNCGHMDPTGSVRHSQHRLTLVGRAAPSAQTLRAQGLAAAEEFRDQQVEKQRMERRLWYTFYLKAYTTVLTEENFKCSENLDDCSEISEVEEGRSDPTEQVTDRPCGNKAEGSSTSLGTASITEEPHEEGDDGDLQEVALSDDKNDDEKDATVEDFMTSSCRVMKLWDAHDTTYRCVEANCSICLGDYEVGDEIVQSAAEHDEEYCIHVFHSECMLQWLAKGKKRCPICRHWFVPSLRIKQQMKQAHVVTRPSSMHHLYDATSRQELASIHDGNATDSDLSGSSQGDIEHGGHGQVVEAQLQRNDSRDGSHNDDAHNANQQPGVENDVEMGLPGEPIEVPGWRAFRN